MESLQTLYTEKTGDVFWRHFFVRVAYLQDERQLARVSPEEFGLVRPEQKAAFHPVSGQPAQTSGVRKRLPFSMGLITPRVTLFYTQHIFS